MHQLGHRTGADGADIADLVAERVEHAAIGIEDLLVAADPDRQFAALRALGPAADRRVEHMDAALGQHAVQPANHRRRIGGQIEIHGARLQAGDQAVVRVEDDAFDLGRAGQAGEHHLGRLGDGARAIGPCRPGFDLRFRHPPVKVVHDDVEPRLA